MKKLLQICVFVSLKLCAQTSDVAAHDFRVVSPTNIVNINSSTYFAEYDCCGELRVNKMNSAGQLVNSINTGIPGLGSNYSQKLITTNDHGLLLLTRSMHSCDLGGLYPGIIKLDTTGVILFSAVLNLSSVTDFVQHSDSSYYFASGSNLIHYSKNGQLLPDDTSTVWSISCISALSNGNLFMNMFGKNIEVNTTYSLVNQQSTSDTLIKVKEATNGKLFGVTNNGALRKYNSDLTLASSQPSSTVKILDFVLRHDSIFAVGTDLLSSGIVYAIIDSNLITLHTSQPTYKNVLAKGIALTGNQINIIAQCTAILNDRIKSRVYYQFPLNASPVSDRDIGVTKITFNSASATAYNFNVTVKNYANVPVTSFYLNDYNYYTEVGNTCYFFHKLYTMTIPAHDSVVVQTGYSDGTGDLISAYQSHVCLFTTVPNNSNDKNIDNDAFCAAVILTGINETRMDVPRVSVSPNPFENILKISCEAEMKKIELYNSTGTLQKQMLVDSKDYNLDCTELLSGIYFIKVNTDKGTLIKKVVKE